LAAGIGAAAGVTFWLGFNLFARATAVLFRARERFKTWQAASPEQRQRIREEDQRLGRTR
jgi:hypothetical protein